MKKIITPVAIIIAMVSLSFNFFAFKNAPKEKDPTNDPNEHIMVEIYEVPTYPDNGVHIHYGNGKTELIRFKGFKKENHDDNGDIIIKAINKLEIEGYELTHTAAGLSSAGMITKVFMKKRA